MQIRTIETDGISAVIATVKGTFEDAYRVAMHFWAIAGAEGVHMDGLEIWDDEGDDLKHVLTISYTTHER